MEYMDRNYLNYKSTRSPLASKGGVVYFAQTSVLTYDLLQSVPRVHQTIYLRKTLLFIKQKEFIYVCLSISIVLE